MNIAAYFASNAQDIVNRLDRSAVRDLLRLRPPPDDLTGLDPASVCLWADLAFGAGMNDQAAKIYTQLSKLEPGSHWPLYQLGRLSCEREDFPVAVEMLSKAVHLSPNFAPGWYELSRVYFKLKYIAKLQEAVAGFLAAERLPLKVEQTNVLTAMAHVLFERQASDEALQLYALLIEVGCGDSSLHARYAECLIGKRQFDVAIELLEPLRKAHSLGDRALRSLALAYSEIGELELASSLLAEITSRNPTNIEYLRFHLRVLCRLGKQSAVATLMHSARSDLGKKNYEDLHIVQLVESADYVALLQMLERDGSYGTPASQAYLMRAISDATHLKKEYRTAASLAARFLTRFGKNIKVLLILMNGAFATRNWQLAKLCLASATEEDFKANSELRIKRFEYYCFTGALDQARIALKDLEPLSKLPKKRIPAVLRYYAEIGDWAALYQLGMHNLDAEFDFERSGYLVFRAVRKVGMHVPAIRQIEQIDDLDEAPALKKLRMIIMEDMIRNDYMLEDLVDDPHRADLAPLQQRLLFKKLVLQEGKKSSRKKHTRYAIYYCTNTDYLGPAFVSLASLVDNNRELVESSDIFMVVDDDALELAKRISAKVSKKLRIDIHLKTRADVIESDVELKERYGLFTAGHSLSEAAYYRIYFAKELYRQGRYDVALYIDSDTIVRDNLHELFESRPAVPLLARLEVNRPEVEAAVAMNNLEPGRYFNSGILLLDLKHPDVGPALDRTIHAIQDSRETLVFHDQCALNIGFKGHFHPLDARFNYFVKPDEDGAISDGVIIHYLDRPKPWDPAYSGKFCGLWFAHWHKLAIHVGGGEAMNLYNLSNRE
jgi:lipopolysaccharide biosynthesis glycosyltransferase/tetratricopeptide (TPR) repeat protein